LDTTEPSPDHALLICLFHFLFQVFWFLKKKKVKQENESPQEEKKNAGENPLRPGTNLCNPRGKLLMFDMRGLVGTEVRHDGEVV